MSQFYTRPDKQHFDPPYALLKCEIGGVVFQGGTEGALQTNLVDPIFNQATADRFQLVVPDTGIAVFGHYPDVHSEADTDSAWGKFDYHEATIFLPLKDSTTEKIYLFFPAMILDASLPLVCGREIYGIPKMLGKFDWEWAENVWSTQVEAEAFSAMDPGEVAGWRPVMDGMFGAASLVERRINPNPPAFREFLDSIPFPGEDRRERRRERRQDRREERRGGVSSSLREAWDFMMGYLSGSFALKAIYLKEFPECGDLSLACYQSLVVSDFTPTAISSLAVGKGAVTFHDPASYPLGTAVDHLPAPATVEGLAFGVEMDWRLGPGSEFT